MRTAWTWLKAFALAPILLYSLPDMARAEAPVAVPGTEGLEVRSFTVVGTHGLVSARYGMLVYDLADPSDPQLVGGVDLPSRFGSSGIFMIEVRGQHAFVPSLDTGFYVVDISDWSAPTVVAQVDLPGAGRTIVLHGNYAYVGGIQSKPTYIVDISDAIHPQVVDSFTYLVGGFFDGQIIGSTMIAASVNVFALDLSNPLAPVPIDTFPQIADCRSLTCRGDRTYALNNQFSPNLKGLTCYDVSDPAAAQWIGRLPAAGTEYDVAVLNDRAWIANGTYGLYAVDISNEASPYAVWCYGTETTGPCTSQPPGYVTVGVTLYGRHAWASTGTSGSAGLLAFALDARGDVDYNGAVTSADIILLVNHVFKSAPLPPAPADESDNNCNGVVTAADVILEVNHVFKGAPEPLCP